MKHPSAEGIWNKGLTRCVSCDCRPRPADMKNSGCDRVWDIEIYNSSMFTEPHIRYDGLPPKNDAGARYAERFLRSHAGENACRPKGRWHAPRSFLLSGGVPFPSASLLCSVALRARPLRPGCGDKAMRLSFATESCPVSRYSDREPFLRKGKADSLVPDDGPVSVPSARRSQSPDRPAGRRYSGIEDRRLTRPSLAPLVPARRT